jgi:hypothetical protein
MSFAQADDHPEEHEPRRQDAHGEIPQGLPDGRRARVVLVTGEEGHQGASLRWGWSESCSG